MTKDRLTKVQAHKARMLASIMRRIEECQATATLYGMTDVEAAISACLAGLRVGVAS